MNNDLAIAKTLTAQRLHAPVHAPAPVKTPSAPVTEASPAVSEASAVVDSHAIERNVQEAVDRLNEQMRQNSRGLNFSIDQFANRTVITVKNTETGEVIRQIPDENLLKVAHSIEALKGLLHNATS